MPPQRKSLKVHTTTDTSSFNAPNITLTPELYVPQQRPKLLPLRQPVWEWTTIDPNVFPLPNIIQNRELLVPQQRPKLLPSRQPIMEWTTGDPAFVVQTPPTVALNTPADTATGQSTTPTLNFTGTDAQGDTIEYNVQVDTVNTFNGQPSIIDSYVLSNSNTSVGIYSGTQTKGGQSFTGNGSVLKSAAFYLQKFGSPTGNAIATIYAHSGTFGTSSVGTGAALATSDVFDVSTLSTSLALTTFTFSGANQITLTNTTKYVIAFEYTGGDASNNPLIGLDTTSPTHAGNWSFFSGAAWSASSTTDQIFYVYTDPVPLLSKFSVSDTGFTAGHPFASGVAKDFTVQAADILTANTTYYWRVRATDPSGSNTYGAWATIRSFVTSAIFNQELLSPYFQPRRLTTRVPVMEWTTIDAMMPNYTYSPVKTETITVTDTILKSITRTLSDTFTLTDTFTSLLQHFITLTEIITLTDTLLKASTRVLSETMTLTDTILKATTRTLSEVLTLTDTFLSSLTSGFTSENLNKLVRPLSLPLRKVMTYTTIDAMMPNFTFTATKTETVTVTDTLLKSLQRTLSETITLTDTFLKSTVRTLSETLTLTDTFLKATTRVLTETITLTDSIIRSTARTLSETMTLSDVLATVRGKFTTLSDTMTLTDTILRATTRVLSETMTVTGTLLRSTARTLSETMTLTDVIATALASKTALLTETLVLTDTIKKASTRVLSEAVVLTVTLIRRLNGENLIWTSVTKSAAATWTKVSKSASSTWTHITRN